MSNFKSITESLRINPSPALQKMFLLRNRMRCPSEFLMSEVPNRHLWMSLRRPTRVRNQKVHEVLRVSASGRVDGDWRLQNRRSQRCRFLATRLLAKTLNTSCTFCSRGAPQSQPERNWLPLQASVACGGGSLCVREALLTREVGALLAQALGVAATGGTGHALRAHHAHVEVLVKKVDRIEHGDVART